MYVEAGSHYFFDVSTVRRETKKPGSQVTDKAVRSSTQGQSYATNLVDYISRCS